MSEKNTGVVRFELDLANPPKLTAEDLAQLAILRRKKDEEIDFSDMPPSPRGTVWTRTGAGLSRRVTLDADVSAFFRDSGDEYESRVNAALREHIEAHRKSA